VAWIIGIGYAILFLVLELIMGVGYDVIGATTDNIIKGIVVPVAVGALVLAVVTTALGWWRPVLFELPESSPSLRRRARRAGCWPCRSWCSSACCSASTTATSATWAAP